jgi:3-dehydroquinate synthase
VERVTVPVPGRSYDVVVGRGLIPAASEVLPDLGVAERAFVVTDAAVAERWAPPLEASLRERGLHTVVLPVPAGEDAKTLQVATTLLHQFASQEAHRDDLVVALGGGATGDLAGFVASTYMRGVPFVQVPTTLAAQVDASIGGKTAVNLPEGKNLIGTFHQPRGVLADVDTLATVPERAYRTGLAEIAKYALALDPTLVDRLEGDPAPLLARDPETLEAVVTRCAAIKARTVAEDELDRGSRMFLNYGHTLGHALERLDGFGGTTHGEAIAVGMVFAARLAERTGTVAEGLAARTLRLLTSLGLEPHGTLPPRRAILDAVTMDKKFHAGVRFVLLEEIGRPVVVSGIDRRDVEAVLADMGAP